ncbi:MAG: aldehyde dehydrogenase family protein [Bacillota bacterium]|jgi:succinate-semialdehyde dehydrogenase
MDNKQHVVELIDKARAAQAIISEYSQEQIDAMVKAMGKIIDDHAVELAKEVIKETGLGNYEHKIMKNSQGRLFWYAIKDIKTVGIINEIPEKNIIEIAKPLGVLGCVSPTTNPTVTPMGNAMFAVKGGNALVVAPHPRAKQTSTHTVNLMKEALAKLGAPVDILQCIEEPSIEGTQALMNNCDVVIATGGMGMVKAAYSSGKPAYGVGSGNVQVIIDYDYDDYKFAAESVIFSRTFDNGLICAGEQAIIIPKDKEDEIKEQFVAAGAYFVEDSSEVDKARKAIFPEGVLNKDVVGQSAQKVAELCGITIPENTKVIIFKPTGIGKDELLCKEKLCPAMTYVTYDTFDEAIQMAKINLLNEGAGHTAGLWSNSQERAKAVGLALPVSRIMINQPTINAAGFYDNGLNPTPSLGCGSWGNNIISENLTIKHMINISRVSAPIKGSEIPTVEEIWT